MNSPSPEISSPSPATHTFSFSWRELWNQTRTRILLLYAMLLLLVTAASIPLFLHLFFSRVDARVREDLARDMENFLEDYRAWERQPRQTLADLEGLIEDSLAEIRPEDDNFLIFFIDGKFFRSTPVSLPKPIAPGSELAQRWQSLKEDETGSQSVENPDLGTILYIAEPLILENRIRGAVVAAHASGGERREALDGVYVFAKVATGVVLISLASAWFLMGKLLSPVKKLAVVARSVSESDLSQRLSVKGSGELADLAITFNSMLDRLQHSFTLQRNFVNDAGHELRTPITIIQGHLEVMGDDPDEQQETLKLVMDELNRMGRMVSDMLLLAKAERPDFLELETIDVRSYTETILSKAQPLGDRRWELKIWGDGRIVGDRQRLTGAILNLAQNAVQHTRVGDLIEIGSSISRHQVRFWVHDSGEGISEADQQRIFERFGRVSGKFRKSDGSGLGLAIAKAIAEAHGGYIELESKLTVGSKFTLVLPIEPPREKAINIQIH